MSTFLITVVIAALVAAGFYGAKDGSYAVPEDFDFSDMHSDLTDVGLLDKVKSE